jgi:hypothetical protein
MTGQVRPFGEGGLRAVRVVFALLGDLPSLELT